MNNPNFPMAAQQRAAGNLHHQLVLHYRKQEQTRPHNQGWQQSTNAEERAHTALQLSTTYKLLKPDGDQKDAVQTAIQIENSCFMQAQTKDQYANAVKARLQQLTAIRQQRMQGMQTNLNNGMNPAQMGMMGQPQPGMQGPRPNQPQQFPPGFPNPQLQRPMQASPIPMTQSQSNMGNNAANGMNFQQGQPTPQPNMQQPQQNQQNDAAALTMLAKRIMQQSNPELVNRFRQEVETWPHERRAQLLGRGMDPLLFRFRQHTETMLKTGKLPMAALQQVRAAAAQQQGQQNQMAQQMNAGQGQPNQNFDFNAIMNQQNEALRVQEAGQQVVPASNSANGGQMVGFPGQNGQNGQQAQNAAAMAQRQAQFQQANIQRQAQQARAQQQLQHQQQQAAAARTQNPLLGQAQMNGLNLPQNGQQPNTMAMLTRPVGQPGPGTPQPRPPQAHVPQMTPQQGQPQVDPQIATQLIREAQQRAVAAGQPLTEQVRMSLMPPNVDPNVKQRLLALPDPQFRALIANQIPQMGRGNGMPNMQFPPGQNTPGQPNMMMNPGLQMGLQNQLMNGGNVQNMARNQGMPLGQQPNGMPGQQLLMGQQQGALNQQQRLAAARSLLQQSPGIIQQTDGTPFPPNVLNAQLRSTLPPDVTTWAQLKQWASQNQALVPTLDANKLVMLQAMHFQEVMMRQQGLMAGAPRPPLNTPGAMAAPQAQMTPGPQPNQNPQQQPNIPGMPPITVTQQEMQKARQSLRPEQQHITDQQLHQYLLGQKLNQRKNQMKMMESQQQRPQQPPQQPQPQQALQQPPQPQQMPGPQAARQQPAQPQSTPQQKPAAKPQAVKTEANAANAMNKGVKRSSDDLNANKAQGASSAPQAPAMVASKSQSGVSNLTQEQIEKLPPDAQARMRAQLLKAQESSNAKLQQQPQQPQQQPQQPQQQRAPPGWQELSAKIQQPEVFQKFRALLMDEEQKAPRGAPVEYTPEARQKLQELVNGKLPHLRKVEQALRIFHVAYPSETSETMAREIIRSRTALLRNINPQTGKLNDELLLSADEFTNNIKHILNFVARIMSKFQSQGQGNQGQQQQQQAQQAQQAQGAQSQQQQNDTQNAAGRQPQLNAANLRIVDQQQRQNKAPQAPTTDRPPFQLGNQSPSGAPKYFEGAPKVTNLHLPDNKKRKLDPSSQTSTPGAKASPRVGTGKVGSPELKRNAAPAEQKPTFKCKTADCDYAIRGFDTQAELEAHVKDAHAKIDDPLQYAINSFAEVVDVDPKTGLSKTMPKTSAKPAAAANKAPQVPIKAGQTPSLAQNVATPAQAAATPMARVPTQPGIKSSPSTNLLKTPQAAGKVATPSTGALAKATPSAKPPKEAEPAAPAKDEEELDSQPFAPLNLFDCSYEDIYGALDTNGPFNVLDLKDEDTSWTLRDLSPMNTPDSSSKDTPSTRISDISENDNLQINVDYNLTELPDSWFAAVSGNPLPLDAQLSEDLQTLGMALPPMDNNDMMLFSGDSFMMDIDSIDSKAVEGLTLDPSLLGQA